MTLIQEKLQPKKWIGVRHVQFALMFFNLLILNGHRTILSVAIIAMTDKTPPDPSIPTYPEWDNTDVILSSFFWGYIIPQIGAGQLGEYFGPKWFLFGTMIIGSIFNALVPVMAQSLGPTGVIICRIIQGLNQAFLYPSTHNLVSKWAPLCERTRIASFVYGGSSLGIVVAMLFSGAVCGSKWGWPYVFYISGGVAIVWALIFGLFAENSPAEHKSISIEERMYIENNNSINSKEKKKVPTPWMSIVTSLPVWAVLVTTWAQNWGIWTLLTEIPSFLSNIMNFDISSDSQLSALPYFVMFIMCFIGAPIADKLISNQVLSIGTTRKVFNSMATFIPGLALFGLGFIESSQKNLAIALLVVAVSATAFANSGGLVNLIDLAPNHAGTLMGISNGSSQIYSIMGPLAVGFLGSDKKSLVLWKKVFWLSAGIYVAGGTFFAFFSSGKVQKWNDFGESEKKSSEECEKNNEKCEKNKEKCYV